MAENEWSASHAAEETRTGSGVFRRSARAFTTGAGSPVGAAIVVVSAAAWVVLGVISRFARWWELLATGAVPFVTLLMLVLIQHTQNHDDRALQLKLDELIRATHSASNRMMSVEDASPQDLDRIGDSFRRQAESVESDQPGSSAPL